MKANIAAAKGIEPCPMCGSDEVRWRKRRPTDFVLTWMRWSVELAWSMVSSQSRANRLQAAHDRVSYDGGFALQQEHMLNQSDVTSEIREANSGHKTPKRFWRCKACNREGHVF